MFFFGRKGSVKHKRIQMDPKSVGNPQVITLKKNN